MPPSAQAGTLTTRSDTLSTSAPAALSDHTILFTTAAPIPASGLIFVTPQAGQFTIPADLDFDDLDLAVNGSEKPLGNVPGAGSGSQYGVTVAAGTSGSIRFTLNNTDPIAVGSAVRIKIGTNATHAVTGNQQIINPASIGSYTLLLETQNAASGTLDTGLIGLAIVQPVGLITTSGTVATPTMSPPGGTFTASVGVAITTTTSGASIYYTTDGSTPTSSSTLYTTALTFTTTTTLKAIAIKSGMNDSSVASETYTETIASPPPPPPSGGGGSGGPGYGPQLTIIYTDPSGKATATPTGGPIRIIHTCDNLATATLDLPADFSTTPLLFTFACIPVSLLPISLAPPEGLALAGIAFEITAITNGAPLYTLRTPGTITLTYTDGHGAGLDLTTLKAFESLGTNSWSPLAGGIFIQKPPQTSGTYQKLGLTLTTAKPLGTPLDCSTRRADLNCDGRVNLTDFSILMYNWGGPKNNPRSDINSDSKVNLTDFSILLYNWTD